MKGARPKKKRRTPVTTLSASRGSFAFIAHELKGTLAAAAQNLYALKDGYFGPVSDEQKKVIAASISYVTYYDSLMKNLFLHERFGEKMFAPEKRRVPLSGIITLAADACRKNAADRGMCIETAVGDDIIVDADAPMLTAAFINLIGNAVVHGTDGSIIRVTARNESAAVIDVYNEGTPIAAAGVRKLFKKFSRLANGTNTRGIGLGLYIVRTIIRRHRGSVVCVPRKAGNSFIVTLPRAAQST